MFLFYFIYRMIFISICANHINFVCKLLNDTIYHYSLQLGQMLSNVFIWFLLIVRTLHLSVSSSFWYWVKQSALYWSEHWFWLRVFLPSAWLDAKFYCRLFCLPNTETLILTTDICVWNVARSEGDRSTGDGYSS
jgi:hypothetical protein